MTRQVTIQGVMFCQSPSNVWHVKAQHGMGASESEWVLVIDAPVRHNFLRDLCQVFELPSIGCIIPEIPQVTLDLFIALFKKQSQLFINYCTEIS